MTKKTNRKQKPPPPPKGNKRAFGYGRPPNEGFADEDLMVLGEELLKWMEEIDKLNKEIVHLSEWYSEIKEISVTQWSSICDRACFRPYYERARVWMGKNILKNDRMPSAYGSRYLGIYHREITEHERSQIEHKVDYEIKKKQEAEKANSNSNINPHLETLQQMLAENKALKEKLNALESETNRQLSTSDS